MGWLDYYHLLQKHPARTVDQKRQPNDVESVKEPAMALWKKQNGQPYVMQGEYFRISSVNRTQEPDNLTVIERLDTADEPLVLSGEELAGLIELCHQLKLNDDEEDGVDGNIGQ